MPIRGADLPSRSTLPFAVSLALFAVALAPLPATESIITNSLGMKLVPIGPGSFAQGSKDGDWDEMPRRKVTITERFRIAATEVTNDQYEEFDAGHKHMRGHRGFSRDDDEAVVFVSWTDAMAFCEWLSDREGKPYRLPTEAEWEYACRAGTTGAYWTGDKLPKKFHKVQKITWKPEPVSLHVARTPANSWGLHDMHGNVEEWCHDWYGPYETQESRDPIGRITGDYRVTRGGSHGTELHYLRSANRSGALPENRNWIIGFRVVQARFPGKGPLPPPQPPLWARDVKQPVPDRTAASAAETQTKPQFLRPIGFVKIPPGSNGPLFSRHNHQPAIVECPNGDLLAIWYTTKSEPGRELGVVASRLRRGRTEWEPAAPFWSVPDRNDHGSALFWDGNDTIYHLNGMSTDATWGKLALIMRTSRDSGATWSPARIINPEHKLHHQVIAGTFRTKEGFLVQPCDAVTGGTGGTAIHISRDRGRVWVDPGAGKEQPKFTEGGSGAWIAGIHAGVVQLTDGRLMALGRGDSIKGRMPKSISSDLGETWTYSASKFPSISSGQRLVLRRLDTGELLLVSFTGSHRDTKGLLFKNAAGRQFRGFGMFAALSYDDGETWPVRRLLTPGKGVYKTAGHTREFNADPTHAEPRGYLAATQTRDGMIQLISSGLHYQFNVAWLKM
jgi:formylglycine-generating enzyme required for sulfatase activity